MMRTIAKAALAGILILGGALPAAADCVRPKRAFEIPAGATASEQGLLKAQGELVEFGDQISDYLRCLNGEVSQRAVGKDEAARQELVRTYQPAYEEAANELKGLAQCYDAQATEFKKSSGGDQNKPADCASFIAAARNSSPQAGTPITTELVIEASGQSHDVASGRWVYYLVRDDSPRRCGARDVQPECLYRAVHVRNDSDEVLECNAEISYEGTDSTGSPKTAKRQLVTERSTYVAVESLAKQGTNAATFDAQCKVRPRLASLNMPAGCKYEVVKPISIADYYPDSAREAGQEGPVVVEFTLTNKAANPTDVRAVASSMYESLDQAAVKAVSDMVMSSKCGKQRFRLKVNFQLQ